MSKRNNGIGVLVGLVLSLQVFAQTTDEKWSADIRRMVDWYSYALNILGSDSAFTADKETIVRESYQRIFRDAKVLIEDDLIENRREVTNKEVQAYLRDVDFFFKRVQFQHNVGRIERKTNQLGRPYFLVETQRILKAIDLDGKEIENRRPRFFEIELNEQKQVLYIVSVYTSRKGLEEDLVQWWQGLPLAWKSYVSSGIALPENTGFLSDILTFDSLASPGSRYTISGKSIALENSWLASELLTVLSTDSLDLSGKAWIEDLGPLAQFSRLKWLSLAHLPISDLTPLRNLNKLEYLDISHCKIMDLSPLRFLDGLEKINLGHSLISDVNEINRLVGLKFADLTACPILDLKNIPLSGNLQHLILDSTQVKDLEALAGFPNLRVLSLNHCPLTDIRALASLPSLSRVYLETTPINSIMPLVGAKKLSYVFCDGSALSQKEAQAFRQAAPHITLVFGTADIKRWWKSLPQDLKMALDSKIKAWPSGSKEFLQALVRIDSLNYSQKDSLDLSLLKPLSELRYLNLNACPLKSVEVLSGFKKLENIAVSNTGINNLNWANELSQLRILHAENNSISDASSLKGLYNLVQVRLDGNPLPYESTITLCNNHPEWNVHWHSEWLRLRWEELDTAWMQVLKSKHPDLPSPDALHRLEHAVSLEKPLQSGLRGAGPATFMPFLEELILPEAGLQDIHFIAPLRRLKTLDISGNPISSLQMLNGLVQLEVLKASATLIGKLDALPNFSELLRLELASGPLESLEGIERFPLLRHLDVSGSKVRRLKPLEKLLGLKTLKVFNTRVAPREAAAFRKQFPECEVLHY
jgi:Leucine-rich repeat (LRR) protein